MFKIAEDAMVERLSDAERATGGAYAWTDTSGVRSAVRRQALPNDGFDLLGDAYPREERAAA